MLGVLLEPLLLQSEIRQLQHNLLQCLRRNVGKKKMTALQSGRKWENKLKNINYRYYIIFSVSCQELFRKNAGNTRVCGLVLTFNNPRGFICKKKLSCH